MRVLFTRPCMRSSRCQHSRFPLFEDFYNWRETVSHINASTKGRSGELFNGIIITSSLDITFLSPFHCIPFSPRSSSVHASLLFTFAVGISFVCPFFFPRHFCFTRSAICMQRKLKFETQGAFFCGDYSELEILCTNKFA